MGDPTQLEQVRLDAFAALCDGIDGCEVRVSVVSTDDSRARRALSPHTLALDVIVPLLDGVAAPAPLDPLGVSERLSATSLTTVAVEPPTISASVSVQSIGDGSGDNDEQIAESLTTNLVSAVAEATGVPEEQMQMEPPRTIHPPSPPPPPPPTPLPPPPAPPPTPPPPSYPPAMPIDAPQHHRHRRLRRLRRRPCRRRRRRRPRPRRRRRRRRPCRRRRRRSRRRRRRRRHRRRRRPHRRPRPLRCRPRRASTRSKLWHHNHDQLRKPRSLQSASPSG